MRQIKFRAWIESQNKTRRVTNIEWAPINCIRRIEILEESGSTFIYSGYILEQFTGLLDKNGREIYEGDILKGEKGGITTVQWREDIDTDRYFTKACGFYFEFLGNFGENADETRVEVVGNIHENPELLR